MTPRKTIQPEKDSRTIYFKWGLTLFAGLIAWFSFFIWNLNSTLAVMQNNEKYREEKVKDIDKNVSTLVNELRSMKDQDMQDIKDRLKTLEVEKTPK
jgi:hypothetical protein